MPIERNPPSELSRRIALILLAITIGWWVLLFAFAVFAAEVLDSVEWGPPPIAVFVAPVLAVVAAAGSIAWMKREPSSSRPILIAGALVTLSFIFTVSIYLRVALTMMFAAMSVDPRG